MKPRDYLFSSQNTILYIHCVNVYARLLVVRRVIDVYSFRADYLYGLSNIAYTHTHKWFAKCSLLDINRSKLCLKKKLLGIGDMDKSQICPDVWMSCAPIEKWFGVVELNLEGLVIDDLRHTQKQSYSTFPHTHICLTWHLYTQSKFCYTYSVSTLFMFNTSASRY